MTLTPGERLGPYEILSAIGSGGMGEVWKARDTRLNREVAIKTSKEEFSERFKREAQAIAALNHPNICQLYDAGPNYLVMELVDGTPLKGPLAADKAIACAEQILGALDAAHRKGITHRDLKPGNILVTKQGIKLLDFGLAKQSGPLKETDATITQALTGAGQIVGTLQYMAPEQLKGQEADSRSDLFAFGCVFYELLTGKRAFEGKDAASVIAAILSQEPEAVSALRPAAPRALDAVVRRCLAKDPDDRWQSARDLREVIARFGGGGEAVVTRGKSPLPWVVAAAGSLAAAVLGTWFGFARSPAAPEMRLDIVTPATIDPSSFALSPDGTKIAYAGVSEDKQQRLWVRSLDSASAQPLAGTEGGFSPFWSPDGRSIGYWGTEGKIKRIDLGGGTPQNVVDSSYRLGADWNADGVILFAPNISGAGIFRTLAIGGQPAPVTKLSRGNVSHRQPSFLPDGKRFLFYALGGDSGIYLGSLDGAEPKRITAADSTGRYLPSGWLLWVQGNTLIAKRFDASSGELSGEPVTLAQTVGIATAMGGVFSVSKSGLVAWRTGSNGRRQLAWLDRAGQPAGVVGSPDDSILLHPALSPDGRRVCVTRGPLGAGDLWLVDNVRASRFTFDAADERYPVWSPDGGRIAYASSKAGKYDLYVKSADGSGGERLLLASSDTKRPTSWSPDGRFLMYWSSENGGDLKVLPMEGGGKPFVFLGTPFNEHWGAFSPDGKWVAYGSNESGRSEVYVRPFPGPGGVWQISAGGGTGPRWSADGKEMYYLTPDSKLVTVGFAARDGSVTLASPKVLFAANSVYAPVRPQYDVSRDGRFLINVELADNATPITLLLNWKPPK